MTPETTLSLSVLIAIVGCFVGLAGWLHSRDSKISEDAEWKGTVNAKLDLVINLRVNYIELESKFNELKERVALLEESNKFVSRLFENKIP